MSLGLGLLLVLISILANAFFAGVETGFTSARRVRLVHWAREGRRGAARAAAMAADREAAVVSAVVGNNVAVVAGTAIATAVAVQEFGDAGETVAAVVMASLNIVFGEILPKTAYRARPETMLLFSAPVLAVTDAVLRPLRVAAVAAARGILWLLRVRASDEGDALTREGLLRTITLSREHEHLDPDETRLLRRFVDNSSRSVGEVVTPLERVAHVGVDARVRDVVERVRATGHSRIPVLGPGDRPRGLLLFRDLQSHDPAAPVEPEIRDVIRLSGTMGIDEGIGALTDRQASLAFVVSAAGETLGIVTLEDLLEPLVGDILDEHDFV